MPRLLATLALAGSLALAVTAAPVARAQAQSGETTAPSSAPQEEQPLMLFVVQHDGKPGDRTSPRSDVNTELSLALRATLREANKYQIILYSPDQPRIRRALLEHLLTADDLEEPLGPEAMQKVAGVLGARYVLAVHAVLNTSGLTTSTRFLEDMGQNTWRTPLLEDIVYAPTIGKRKLKQSELVALTVDTIGTRLGVPSHMAERLNLNATAPSTKPDKTADKAGAKTKAKPEIDPPASGDAAIRPMPQLNGDEQPEHADPQNPIATRPNGATPPTTLDTVPDKPRTKPKRTTKASGGKRPNRQIARNESARNVPPVTAPPSGSPAAPTAPSAETGTQGTADKNKFATLAPDNNPTRDTEPILVAPPTNARPDYEAEAARYRQAGDTASAITSLRHAINEKPRDPALRRQLVQLYQDRHLTQAALDETTRALRLAPDDPELQRLQASAQLENGDAKTALEILRATVQQHPNDVAARVSLGDALLADNQYADALASYRAAAETDVKSPLPHRRLARVFAAQAASNSRMYALSLDEVSKARALTPAQEIETYQSDYAALMKRVDTRLRDMVDELQTLYLDHHNGKRTGNPALRAAADLKERTQALSDYLDKLPPAAGQDGTHAHYQQGAALLMQAVGLFRRFLTQGDSHIEDELKSGRSDALSEINAASRLLNGERATPSPSVTNGNG